MLNLKNCEILNSQNERKKIIMTQKEKEIFIGCILGDGHLRKIGNSIHLSISHSIKQKKFIYWKYKKLIRLCNNPPRFIERKPDKRTGKQYNEYQLITKANSDFDNYYFMTYKNKKRIIDKRLLDMYTSLSLAVHYMDDGSRNYNGAVLNVQRFDINSINNLITKLESWNLKCTIRVPNIIYIRVESILNLKNLIEPHIIESMRYKI